MKKTARFNFFIKLTILVVICFCAVNIVRLRNEYDNLRDREQELLEEKQQYEEEIHRLREDLARPMDDEYVMRIAREKLNYYLPDEIVFFNDR
jgi:cell division protein FtsL